MLNRRNFLKNTSLLATGGLLAGKINVAEASTMVASKANASKNFGLQIYSLTVDRNDTEFNDNVPNGLKKVAQLGYTSIELAGYTAEGKIGAVPMAEFKKYADDAGLKIVSTHVNPPMRGYSTENIVEAKEFWKKATDHHAAIGCKYILQPGQPQTRNTEEIAYVGEAFNEFGKIAKAAGLIFAFHNHDGEFLRVVPGGTEALPRTRGSRIQEGSKMIYDGLLEATDPSLVQFEMDVYWTVIGGQDPVAYMKKYANRIRILHIKDVAVLGESGMMNFQKIFETAYVNGIADFFVELENYPDGPQFEGVKGCANYLLNAPFVK